MISSYCPHFGPWGYWRVQVLAGSRTLASSSNLAHLNNLINGLSVCAKVMESPSSASGDESGAAAGSDNHKDANNSTPSSSSKPVSVRKDRLCPFCKQVFTSSSLGRHLDFFIRDKRPKLPDGVHDVDQIRKLRSAITRRHARTSAGLRKEQQEHKNRSESVAEVEAKTETQSNSSSVHHTPNIQPRPTLPPPPPPPPPAPLPPQMLAQSQAQDQAPRLSCEIPSLNRPPPSHNDTPHLANWTATGVINNLPPRMASGRFPRLLPRPDLQHSRPASLDADENDNARATELALREVLDTLKQAIAQERQKPIFDFDFLAMSFPALCLNLLGPPPTFQTPFPMPTPSTWPTVGVPGRSHFEAVHEAVVTRLRALQSQMPDDTTQISSMMQPYFNHINETYRHWEAHSQPQQQNLWLLELIRALTAERSTKETIEQRLDDLQQEVYSLRTQLDVAHSQHALYPHHPALPSPSAVRAGNTHPLAISSKIVQDLHKSGVDVKSWDFENLVNKWKPIAQKERRRPWPVSLPRTPTDSNVMPPLRSMSTAAPPQSNSGSSSHMSMYTPPAVKLLQDQSLPANGSGRSSLQGMNGDSGDAEYENDDEMMEDNNQAERMQNIDQAERYHQRQPATVAGDAFGSAG